MTAVCLAGALSAGVLAGPAAARVAEVFSAVFQLASLYPVRGGDGSAGFVLNGIDTKDYSGGEVSGAGDINGDGFDDVLISSAVADPHGLSKAGETYVVFGRAESSAVLELRSLLPAAGGDGRNGFVLKGIDSYEYSGNAISSAGDINGDAIEDIIVGGFRADLGREAVGECYVVFGRTTGFPPVFELRRLRRVAGGDGSEGFIVKGATDLDEAGYEVSKAGDVNGDGIADLLLSAFSAGGIYETPGQAYVVFGRTSGFPAELALRELLPVHGGDGSEGFAIQGIEPRGHIGRSVSGAGDVNGDGIDDVLIGSSNAQENAGESYVVFGRTTGFPPLFALRNLLPQQGGNGSVGLILRGADSFDFAGYSVSGAGDANADGVDDLLIGAWGADPGGMNEAGVTYLVFGRTTGFPALLGLGSLYPGQGGDGSAGVVFSGRTGNDRSGQSVSGAGDVNGDGIADVMIGAYSADAGPTEDAGETYVVYGRSTGFPAVFELERLSPGAGGDGSEGFIIAGARANDGSGTSVSDAGDVNGDSVGDLIIGASYADPGGRMSAGASYVVFGRR
jgi:hypothetical protein